MKEHICTDCKIDLIVGLNWYESSKKINRYICISCLKLRIIKWKNENPEKYKEQRINNRHTYSEKDKEYYQNNKDVFRERTKISIHKKKIKVLSHYSNDTMQCKCCGENHIEFLTIDHINNNGAEHKRKENIKSSSVLYTWLIKNKFPEGFQVLCFNCNIGKGRNECCPHKRQ